MEIWNFKEIRKGCLIGKFDVKIAEWGLLIKGCCYFEKDGKRWVNLPSSQIQNQDGSVKRYDHVVFDKGIGTKFHAACLEKLKKGEYQTKEGNAEAKKIPF